MLIPPELVAKRIVDWTLRNRFRRIYWNPPAAAVQLPAVLCANHFTWHDGFLLGKVCWTLGYPAIALVEDPRATQVFKNLGAIGLPNQGAMARGRALKRAIRDMQKGRLLTLFPEGILHPPQDVLPFQFGLDLINRTLEGTTFWPIAIHTELCYHERPEAWVYVGDPVQIEGPVANRLREYVCQQLKELQDPTVRRDARWKVLVEGKRSGHER